MDKLHTTSPERCAAFAEIMAKQKGTDGNTQCERLLQAIRRLGHVTTYEALKHLDIYRPPSRKFDLVQAGHEIVTSWRIVETMAGQRHRVGVYSLAK
jgi:hypothetical protein